jgi:hypothetical protein
MPLTPPARRREPSNAQLPDAVEWEPSDAVRTLSNHEFISFQCGELRLQSRHVVGVPMENRPTMRRRDGAP